MSQNGNITARFRRATEPLRHAPFLGLPDFLTVPEGPWTQKHKDLCCRMSFEAIHVNVICILTEFLRGTRIWSLILIILCTSRAINNILKFSLYMAPITHEWHGISRIWLWNHVLLEKPVKMSSRFVWIHSIFMVQLEFCIWAHQAKDLGCALILGNQRKIGKNDLELQAQHGNCRKKLVKRAQYGSFQWWPQ